MQSLPFRDRSTAPAEATLLHKAQLLLIFCVVLELRVQVAMAMNFGTLNPYLLETLNEQSNLRGRVRRSRSANC
jgi:hypothetical protein